MQSPNDWYEPGMTYKLVKNGGKSLYHRSVIRGEGGQKQKQKKEKEEEKQSNWQ